MLHKYDLRLGGSLGGGSGVARGGLGGGSGWLAGARG